MIGTILDGKYRIDRMLGKGGMGAVYAGEETASGRTIAVKIIQAQLPVRQADLVARFEREARAAGAIDTDHIARCLGAGTDTASGQPYMVLEYLEGEDLQHVLRRTGPIDPGLALRITAQACEGLRAAHGAGIIHRDIKPANLFLAKRAPESDERVVKILDFGIAKILHDPGEEEAADTGGLTRTGSLLGSPLYMSPEQARSVKKVDQRADLWSLGVVLYRMLAGRTPFDHVSAIGDMILALWTEPPAPVQQFAPWIPPELALILDRMLQVEPADRYQSAAEVLAAITPMLPDGTAVHEPMLTGISDAARGRSAPLFFRRFDTRPRPRTDPNPGASASDVATPARAITADPTPAPIEDSGARTPAAQPPAMESLSPSAQSGTSQPGFTQTGLSATGGTNPNVERSALVKTIALAGAVALGAGLAYLALSHGTHNTAPTNGAPPDVTRTNEAASSATNGATVTPASAEVPSGSPQIAASSAIGTSAPPAASPTGAVTATLPPGPSARPTAAPSVRPKATTTASATAAPSGTTPKFTDFGDRK